MPNTFIIPKGEMTLTEQRGMREAAITRGKLRAIESKRVAGSVDELDARALENIWDIGAAVDEWRTAALAVVGTDYTVFQAVVLPTTLANTLHVYYKVGIETTPCPVGLLIFRTGGALGNIIGVFDLKQLANALEPEGYFNRPVVYDPQTPYSITARCVIATGVFARVQLGAYVIEPAGLRIAT